MTALAEDQTWIYFLADEDGAHLVAQGIVPEYMKEQAIASLALCPEGAVIETSDEKAARLAKQTKATEKKAERRARPPEP